MNNLKSFGLQNRWIDHTTSPNLIKALSLLSFLFSCFTISFITAICNISLNLSSRLSQIVCFHFWCFLRNFSFTSLSRLFSFSLQLYIIFLWIYYPGFHELLSFFSSLLHIFLLRFIIKILQRFFDLLLVSFIVNLTFLVIGFHAPRNCIIERVTVEYRFLILILIRFSFTSII